MFFDSWEPRKLGRRMESNNLEPQSSAQALKIANWAPIMGMCITVVSILAILEGLGQDTPLDLQMTLAALPTILGVVVAKYALRSSQR